MARFLGALPHLVAGGGSFLLSLCSFLRTTRAAPIAQLTLEGFVRVSPEKWQERCGQTARVGMLMYMRDTEPRFWIP